MNRGCLYIKLFLVNGLNEQKIYNCFRIKDLYFQAEKKIDFFFSNCILGEIQPDRFTHAQHFLKISWQLRPCYIFSLDSSQIGWSAVTFAFSHYTWAWAVSTQNAISSPLCPSQLPTSHCLGQVHNLLHPNHFMSVLYFL